MKGRYLIILLAFISILSTGFGLFRQWQWVKQQAELEEYQTRNEQCRQGITIQTAKLEKLATQLERLNHDLAQALDQRRTQIQKKEK